MHEELLEKLNSKTDKSTGCWIYQGAPNDASGYCKIMHKGVKAYLHRWSAHIHWGFDLNSPMLILHGFACTHRNCWNPAHLREGTHEDNVRDSIILGTHTTTRVITHCPQGHEYTSENIGINGNSGKRYCKECNRIRARERRA